MREQINRFARGDFEFYPLEALASADEVNDTVWKNKGYQGELIIKEARLREIKGVAYSSNNKVRLLNTQFVGAENRIAYIVDADGVEPGDKLDGAFSIVTNGGELKVPYEFSIESGGYGELSDGIKNIYQFAELAQKDFEQATKIFADDSFERVFLKNEPKQAADRRQLLEGKDLGRALEEFLVGIGKKKKTDISIEKDTKWYGDIKEDIFDSVLISKDGWGKVNVIVKCDNDFVEPSKVRLTEEDFAGGQLQFRYSIRRNKLHGGWNMARLNFATPYGDKTLVIKAAVSGSEESRMRSIEAKKLILKLSRMYIDLRLHRMNLADWIKDSRACMESLLHMDDENPYYCLVMSHLMFVEKNMNQANFYLEAAKDAAVMARQTDPVLYCYYLYLTIMQVKDKTYTKETTAKIKYIYEKECHSWKILWLLLYIDLDLARNKSLKLLRIKEQFNEGMRSPLLYMEACNILNDQPMLLRVLNDFERNVILFGCREVIVESRLAKQAAELAIMSEGHTGLLFRLLKELYNESKDVNVLESVCCAMIRLGMEGKKYEHWYELGIKNGLKVTKLYEYYMASRSLDDDRPLPKTVLLYFGYDNELTFEQKSYMYANLIKYRDRNPQIFVNYEDQMIEFVRRQLLLGRADKNTGVIFKEFLTPGMINRDNAGTAAAAMFTYRLECKNRKMSNVCVSHKELAGCDRYPVINGTAYIKVYTDSPSICFQDSYGNYYGSSIEYSMVPVYDDAKMINELYPYCRDNLLLSLHFCEKKLACNDNSLDTIRMYNYVMSNPSVDEAFRHKLMAVVIDYYFGSYEGDDVDRLSSSVDVNDLNESSKGKLVESLIIHGRYKEAFEFSSMVRTARLSAKRVLNLCDSLLAEMESSRYKDAPQQLVDLAFYAFSKGKYDGMTLRLLGECYNGATRDMADLWVAMRNNKLDTFELEERLLSQIIFTGNMVPIFGDMFEHHYNNGARERVVEALLAWCSYRYFVRGEEVPTVIFEVIETRLEARKDVINICRMALLKYYNLKERLGVSQKALAFELMKELIDNGYVFAFFKELGTKVGMPWEIEGRTIVEYKASPECRVVINYQSNGNGDYISQDMKRVYADIFVKSFVMFNDESITYYITCENEDGETQSGTNCVDGEKTVVCDTEGRYNFVNRMVVCMEDKNYFELERLMKIYSVNDEIVSELFRPME